MVAPRASLSGLPTELEIEIASHLDYAELLPPWQTNKYFHDILTPQYRSVGKKTVVVEYAETHTRHANAVGCSKCFRILPSSRFARRQTT